MTETSERVFCEVCRKEITNPEDLVVFTRYFFGGLRVHCTHCFGLFAKRGNFNTEVHVVLNDMDFSKIIAITVFHGCVLGLLIWFAYLANQPFVEKGPGVDVALAVTILLVISSYIKLMVQRWITRVHYENPLNRRVGRP